MKPVKTVLPLGALVLAGSAAFVRAEDPRAAGQPLPSPAATLAPAAAGIGRTVRLAPRADLAGTPVALPVPRAAYTVVALTGTTCPVSQKLGPTLAALEKAYAAKGVRFVYVNPSPVESAADMDAMRRRLGWRGAVVRDPDQRWAKALGARTTTDTYVLDAHGKIVYRGAVDDQYAVGASLPAPRNRFLASALDALLAGRSPKVCATTAPGCLLPTPEAAAAPVPTYHGRIQHVVQKHCVPCHRKDGVAPFALDSYGAVKARAAMLRQVVDNGTMPPWFAAKGTGPWRDDPTIADADKEALAAWAEGGMPKGDPKQAPAPLVFESSWRIGKPDAVFQIPEPIAVKATGTMPYQNVDVPTGFTEDKWIQKIEVVPGDRRVVHHVLVFIQKPGSGGLFGGSFEELRGFFGAYAPGNGVLAYPDGLAKRIPKGAHLRFQIHYTPNGVATTDQSKIGLVFSKVPVTQEVHTTSLANLTFAIPPGADNHEVEARLRVPRDATILSYFPHSHVRGKAARYEIVRRGSEKPELLLDVPRYDFNWQLGYVYEKPLDVKAGDQLVYRAWYDNSDKNPSNPDPKKTVRWGDQTFDEMHLGYFEYLLPGETPGAGTGGLLSGGGFGLGLGTGARRPSTGAGMTPERLFGLLDRDRDGAVGKDEAGALWDRIAVADTDGDGKISLEEAKALLGRRGGARP